MTSTGIGAPVRRREDFRFITGSGQYVDDISRPGRPTPISSARPTRTQSLRTSI